MTLRRTPGLYALGALLIALGVAAGVAMHRLWEFRNGIERLADQLTLDAGPESTLLYDGNNNLVSALFEEHRIGVRLEEISPHLINAVLVTEDRRFYDHDGVDVRRVLAAAAANYRAGEIVQGGSTITQQLVRSILLSREKSYTRKLKEAILARRLEERYAKRAILEAYLNRVYFGDGYYGIEAASLGYFGKPAHELDAVESALLAGLIKGPSLYSPTRAPELAKQRRDLVLELMREEGMLTDDEYQLAVSLPVKALLARSDRETGTDLRHLRAAEYFRDAVARELIARFGQEAVYTGGLRVYTTLDRRLQSLAEETISSRLNRSTRVGREVLQGALVAIEPGTGHVKAIVGGRDFREAPFNRAIDARRQPGSAFKPFIFAAALESGYAPSSQLDGLDEPIPTDRGPWLPGGEHEVTSIRLRDALVVSSNRAAAHLLQDVGVHRAIDFVQRFGVTSALPAVPSLALGTGEMSLFELTAAYTVFANRGIWRQPTTIRRVLDRYGREIYRAPELERPVISEATAYLMTSMMTDVIDRGTANTARAAGLRLTAAGKTGTSQSYADAWFVGYTPKLVTGVWFGYDRPQTIMNRGFASVVAVPTWARFMAVALKDTGKEWFDMPASLTTVRLCRISGLLATDRCHLPVIEPAPFNPEDPLAPAAPLVREGGVYDELRHVHRQPQPCPLPHGESRYGDDFAIETLESDDPDVNAQDPSASRAAAEIIMGSPRAEPPPSMRPAPPPPVMTVAPNMTAPQPQVIPGSNISTMTPIPPRRPDNGSPPRPHIR